MFSKEKLEELKAMMTVKPYKRIRITERIPSPYKFKGQPFPQAYRGANYIAFIDKTRLSKLAHRYYVNRHRQLLISKVA